MKGYGLEDISEESLEACNKHIRRCREHFSFEDIVKDIFVRLLSQSDPGLVIYRKFSKRSSETNKDSIKSYQEYLVNSLIISDEFY